MDKKNGIWKRFFVGDAVYQNEGLEGIPFLFACGELDIPGILRQAKKVGIKHYFIEDESDHVSTQVPQSIAYLKSLRE